MKIFFLFFFQILQMGWASGNLDLSSALSENCSAYLDSCEYYSCRERLQSCGPDGYFERFALPYCNRFVNEVRFKMSLQGQEWLDEVGHCLREKVEQISVGESCPETENLAISTHEECYVTVGFCELSFSDKFRILQTVYRELLDPRVRNVFREVALKCSPFSKE